MNGSDEPRWLVQVRAQLDADARDLDAATASRLNRVRQHALDGGLGQRRSRGTWFPYALAASMAAVLALTLTLRAPEQTLPPAAVTAAPTVDDLDLLAGTEELELIENLEFYAWLEQQSLDG